MEDFYGADMDLHKILEQVQAGDLSAEEAAKLLRSFSYENLGHTRLDHQRKMRRGFGEVVYAPGKTVGQLLEIFDAFKNSGENALATRASADQAKAVLGRFPNAFYDEVSKVLRLEAKKVEVIGRVAVCSAGTGDLFVAEEAALVAEFLGARVDRYYDVGVAGIHRLFSKLDQIRKANAVAAVAGMEGALGSVIAGLVDVPVVAVPTSVGYGASFGGLSALLTMLNSCSEGLSVVNIDNGFGAGYLLAQINRLVEEKHAR